MKYRHSSQITARESRLHALVLREKLDYLARIDNFGSQYITYPAPFRQVLGFHQT